MPTPSTNISVLDPSLGVVAEDPKGSSAKIGVCSLGVANTIYSYRGPDTKKVRDELGEGPLVEAVVHHLNASKGKTVYACKITASVAGTHGAITRSNGASPIVSVAGAPLDDYSNIIRIAGTGALGVGTFQISQDGGDVYGPLLTIPSGGSYVVPGTGMTLTFPAGTYTAGDTYTWTSVAPGFSNADFSAAIDALIAVQSNKWRFVHLVGQGVDASAALTLATTMQSKLEAARALKRYARGVVEMPAVDKALLITAFAALAADRVSAAAGFLEMVSDVSGRIYKRSFGHVYAPRLARNPISVDAIRNDTDSNIESLSNVVRLVPQGATAATGYHDEGATPGLDAARFATAMTIPDVPGFFVTNPNLMSAPGSDFTWMQRGFVMDRLCEIVNQAMTKYLSKRLLLGVTGFIDPGEAFAIETDILGQIKAGLQGEIISASVVVNRADNLLSSPILRLKARVVPYPHAKTIEAELGFTNPALLAAAA